VNSVMIDLSKVVIERKILGGLSVLVLCAVLVVGLWPFHAPINEVTWLGNANGLSFGRHGTVLSSSIFTAPGSRDEASCSLEIWLQPLRRADSNTFLAFNAPDRPLQFSLRQSETDLALQLGYRNEYVRAQGAALVYVDEIFRKKKLLLIAITSGAQGTRIYVDGILARTAQQFRLSAKDFTGQLVLGTSPAVNDSWSGQLRGLAIYQDELTAAQVSRHFETWTTKGRPDIGQSESVLALYLFDEHQGRVVHNRSSSGIDLYIPERYLIVREKFLEPPWKEFYVGWSYWKNVGINIGGFIPLGFFFCAYLTSLRQVGRPALVTIVLGAAVSLTIEVLQAYLPTRDSGMTDIITNTLGTCLGVLLYRWQAPLLNKTVSRIAFAALR
jgi:VanZ like family/Concanavalin A-like lectin/glucanases superfamily